MVVPFSPHREGGGTIHLPSPTHLHHADPTKLVDIHRSLSRSPSKPTNFCLITSKSGSPIPTSPLSPSPPSPQFRTTRSSSPLTLPYPSSTRKSRSTARRLSPMPGSAWPMSTQRSPAKRALSDCSDNGNATPSPPPSLILGVEDNQVESNKPVATKLLDSEDAMNVEPASSDQSPINSSGVFGRRERATYFDDLSGKSSPLKRSDTSTRLELTYAGSPSAKRRSLHSGSFGIDFDIFDQHAAMQGNKADEATPIERGSPGFASPVPRRTGSLRKATLQQRHEKPHRPRMGLESSTDAPTPNPLKTRPRMSLDNYPQPSRESPFSSQGSLPNASAHPIAPYRRDLASNGAQGMSQRHPLSRTITQSSSSSSFDESPTTESLRQMEARKANPAFARSLPLHTSRPVPVQTEDSQSSSQDTQYGTPDNYKLARPLAQAFMSTGLISKRNKIIEQDQLDARESIGHMPDTPCKRPFSLATMSPSVGTPTGMGHAKQSRHTLHSFGTPSTPFNPHASVAGNLVSGTSVFGGSFNGQPPRRGSFVAADIPTTAGNQRRPSTFAMRSEIPPTPTKPGHRADSVVPPSTSARRSTSQVPASFGQSFFESSSDEDNDGSENWDISASPSTRVRPQSFCTLRPEDNSDQPASMRSPTPHSKNFNTVPFSRRRAAKPHALPSGVPSPVFEKPRVDVPETPAEMMPPDPSRLSISVNAAQAQGFGNSSSGFPSFFPPATPTTNRDSFRRSSHKPSLTPIHQIQAASIDESITARFDKVELIGIGEFSSVFRGIKYQNPADRGGMVGIAAISDKPPTRSWAVKKTRHAYLGQRDRQQKLQEVEMLRALGRSDHTIEFIDSWEFGQHLYIQTDYCEEGGLDVFLEKVGRKGRLDDFRIWKVMLELSEGLKHIHEAGIIHLDLKPANVLITFEGVLKIADFGMATFWPATPGIEGEGDRYYIAPEILRGKFDKPADIFALGLIMLEIAGNVDLPENGEAWQRLRSGDMSDVATLTSSSLGGDSSSGQLSGSTQGSFNDLEGPSASLGDPTSWLDVAKTPTHRHHRSGELQDPPSFMVDPNNANGIDKVVRWMISPEPTDRPQAADLLETFGVHWVQARRRAGATIYEGHWGPADEVLQDDAEMIDV